jgi:hypothetical protein
MSPRQRSPSKWLESPEALNGFESAGLRVGNQFRHRQAFSSSSWAREEALEAPGESSVSRPY